MTWPNQATPLLLSQSILSTTFPFSWPAPIVVGPITAPAKLSSLPSTLKPTKYGCTSPHQSGAQLEFFLSLCTSGIRVRLITVAAAIAFLPSLQRAVVSILTHRKYRSACLVSPSLFPPTIFMFKSITSQLKTVPHCLLLLF